ncbi:MAG: BON domain-containing protein [Janthinobacterium lividum]
MFTRKYRSAGALASACILMLGLSAIPALAQTQAAPDNSGNNRVQNRTETADQGKNDKLDRMMTAKIRRAVVADKSLSMYAHNIKIVVVGGAVTLKGPVHSEAEKQTVAEKATQVAGTGKVDNQITVKQ